MSWTHHKIANEFLARARRDQRALTNMQVQKLVFIAHGFALALMDQALVSQDVHAFEFGPVFPRLYKSLRKYGSGNVTDDIPVSPEEEAPVDEDEAKVIDAVWTAYGTFSGSKLSSITHMKGTPWDQVYHQAPFTVIPNDVIRDYYAEKLHGRAEASA